MVEILREMAESSQRRATDLDRAELTARVADAPPVRELDLERFGVIAEFKRRAPSAGALGDGLPESIAAYEAGGAVAISVLTEPSRFDGSLADLAAVAALTERPVIRKDFLIDDRQLLEARIAGASGALLMASLLGDGALRDLMGTARELGLFVLAEAHDAEELDRIHTLRSGDPGVLVGLNTRDFATLTTDLGRLAAHPVRPGVPTIAESGMNTPSDARYAAELGYRGILVGSALMRSGDARGLVAAMTEAGRAACASS